MILLLHNRYRLPGGEERAVEDLAWLIREHLGEDAEVLERDSGVLGNRRAVAGLLRGGLAPEEVAHAVRRTRARVVHAHNVNPSFGWRALAAAREAGARVVLHLHNYRLVCAQGLCFTQGEDCTRCHGRNTLPGVRLNCRGASRAEAAAYGAGLSLWQRRLAEQVDAFAVPSAFALGRLRELGAPVGDLALDGADHVCAVVDGGAQLAQPAEGERARDDEGVDLLGEPALPEREAGRVGGRLGARAAAAVEPDAGERVTAVAARAVLPAREARPDRAHEPVVV